MARLFKFDVYGDGGYAKYPFEYHKHQWLIILEQSHQ